MRGFGLGWRWRREERERNLGDESAKGVSRGEDGGWGVGWWVGRREKMD